MSNFAERLLRFLTTFPLPDALPEGVAALSPFREPAVNYLVHRFSEKHLCR